MILEGGSQDVAMESSVTVKCVQSIEQRGDIKSCMACAKQVSVEAFAEN